jgi:hypothetical protein
VTDTGYCPHCGRPLSGLTVAARGYCEQHGWQWAEWTRREPVCAPLCGASKAYGRYHRWWHHEPQCPVRMAHHD